MPIANPDLPGIQRAEDLHLTAADGVAQKIPLGASRVFGTTLDGTALALTLPPPADMNGQIISIYFASRGGTTDMTVVGQFLHASGTTITLGATGAKTLIYSDGRSHFVLAGNGVVS